MPQTLSRSPNRSAGDSWMTKALIQRYEALPPRAKIVLHLKATAGPYVEKDVLSRAASMVKIPLPDGKT